MTVLWLGAVLAAVWLPLAGAAPASLAAGLVVIASALWWSRELLPPRASPWRVRPAGLLGFAPYFLWHSLRGGTDVALRAFRPRMALNPRFETYRVRLPPGAPRVFFVNVLSLLPGTLGAGLEGDRLTVHVIGEARPVGGRLEALEARVARVFGAPLGEPPRERGAPGAVGEPA